MTTVAEYPPPPEPGTTPAERLIYLRWLYNLTQPELAAIGGTTQFSLSDLENGHTTTFRPSTIRAISDHFHLPYWSLGAYDQLSERTTAHLLYKARMYRLADKEAAAAHFGVSVKTYHNWEHGRISRPIAPEALASWASIIKQQAACFATDGSMERHFGMSAPIRIYKQDR